MFADVSRVERRGHVGGLADCPGLFFDDFCKSDIPAGK